MKNKMSAKDLAFMREKTKLCSKIGSLQKELMFLKHEWASASFRAEKYHSLYEELLKEKGITDEEFQKHLKETAEIYSLLRFF